MPKLISNWEDLAKEKSSKGFKIELEYSDGRPVAAWILPIKETKITKGSRYYDYHEYLSTHTFYGMWCQQATYILQRFGFDVFIDNWDKTKMTDNTKE